MGDIAEYLDLKPAEVVKASSVSARTTGVYNR